MRQFISEERLHGYDGGTWLQLTIFNECAHCLSQMKRLVCFKSPRGHIQIDRFNAADTSKPKDTAYSFF